MKTRLNARWIGLGGEKI